VSRREEAEKFNVWVAWLNLENLYGQPPGEAAMALFRRALPHVNQKRLYLALLAILERTGRARAPRARPPTPRPARAASTGGAAVLVGARAGKQWLALPHARRAWQCVHNHSDAKVRCMCVHRLRPKLGERAWPP
jgi:hypothetical protein